MRTIFILFILFSCDQVKDPEPSVSNTDFKPKREIDQTAYALGTKYAQATLDLKLDQDAQSFFIKGIQDYYANKVKYSIEEINMYALRVDDIIAYQRAESAKSEKEKGEQFIEELLKRDPKFQKSTSGLTYKVFKKGNNYSTTDKTFVKMSYRSFHLDGKRYEATHKGEPRKVPYRGLLKAWQEAFNLAGANSSIIVYAPPELTYGTAGAAPYIKPGEYLKFQIRFYEAYEE